MLSVDFSPYVVASGLSRAPHVARVTITLLPRDVDSKSPAGPGSPTLQEWPRHAHGRLASLQHVRAIDKAGVRAVTLPITSRGTMPPDHIQLVENLWSELMAADDGEWQDLLRAFEMRTGPAQRAEAPVVPLPMAEAGLAIPLERARTVLEALAQPDSPLLARAPARPPSEALLTIGRPWLGAPGMTSMLASLQVDSVRSDVAAALFGPPDVSDWVAACRVGDEAGRSAGDRAYLSSLDPDELARAAVGHDGRDMLGVFDRLHALMHAAVTAAGAGRADVRPTSDLDAPPQLRLIDVESNPDGPAIRRFRQLIASPTLMRLFGLTRDMEIDISMLAEGLWALSLPEIGGANPCAASLKTLGNGWEAGFYPVTQAEWNGAVAKDTAEQGGLVLLGRPGGYGIVTNEPALSASSSLASGQTGDPLGGGLALVPLAPPVADAMLPLGADGVLCSERLRSFDRLDVGVEQADGSTEWYCSMHRTVRWSDPDPSKPKEWIEYVLAALGTGGARRWELDGAGCIRSVLTPRLAEGANAPPCFKDTRIGVYAGSPSGVAADEPYWDTSDNILKWGHQPVKLERKDAIAINQAVTVPGATFREFSTPPPPGGWPPSALAPQLRFGWRYRMGLRRVWLGGATRLLADAARAYVGLTEAPQPPVGAPAREYLRHEPLRAPLVAMPSFIQHPTSASAHEDQMQTARQMAVVSWGGAVPSGHRSVQRTERILLAAPVSLEFATLHEVLDDAPPGPRRLLRLRRPQALDRASGPRSPPAENTPIKKQPPARPLENLAICPPAGGLQRLALHGRLSDDPEEDENNVPYGEEISLTVLPAGSPDPHELPYYPDPAACFLAVGLRERDGSNWAASPQLLRVRGDLFTSQPHRWPDVLPARIVLVKGELGVRRLTVRPGVGALACPDPSVTPHPAMVVEVALGPGEQVELEAWFVPGVADLAAWFDVCHSIELLAVAGSDAPQGDPNACMTGLQGLLGSKACAHAEGDGQDDDRRRVASLLWARLREGPVPLVAQVQQIAMIHAVPCPRIAPLTLAERPIAVARRLKLDQESAAAFLARVPDTATWPRRQDEDGAVGVMVGGTVMLDLASTSGLLVEARVASPDSPLDSGPPWERTDPALVPADLKAIAFELIDGRPSLTPLMQLVPLLEVTGIPPRASGGRPAAVDLGELQQMTEAGLRIARPARFADGGARKMMIRLRALPRHATMLDLDNCGDSGWSAVDDPVWLNATIRPGAPDPAELVPLFDWQDESPGHGDHLLVWRKTRISGLRLTLRRPWYTSGEGEELGVLFWPPRDAALPSSSWPEALDQQVIDKLRQEDIGPLGPFVSAWGRDPLRVTEPADAPFGFALSPGDLISTGDPFTVEDLVLVPVHGEPAAAEPPSTPATPVVAPAQCPPAHVAASPTDMPREHEAPACLLRTAPRYDKTSDQWYVDLALRPAIASQLTDRFIRLGLVRYQPHAREDRGAAEGGRRSIRCSAPATAWTILPPRRELRVTLTRDVQDAGTSLLTVQLVGAGDPMQDKGTAYPRTVIQFEVVYRNGANETSAVGPTGEPLRADTVASGPGVIVGEQDGLRTWTAAFRLPGHPEEAIGRYSVLVQEEEAMPRAGVADAAPAEPASGLVALVRAGMRFFARIDLDYRNGA